MIEFIVGAIIGLFVGAQYLPKVSFENGKVELTWKTKK